MRRTSIFLGLLLGCAPAAPISTETGSKEGTDGADGASDGADGGSDGADGGSDGADGASDGADGGSDGADGADGGSDGGGEPLRLYINELMPGNDGFAFPGGPTEDWTPDWIELYNPNPVEVNLDGCTLSDDFSEPDKFSLDGLSIPAGGHLVLIATDEDLDRPDITGFTLSGDGEELGLYGPEGQALDRVSWGPLSDDWAAARLPDGGTLNLTNLATPGEANPEGTSP
jgi:hypothetical protein